MKRDRAVLDYLVGKYGKENVKNEISDIRKEILIETQETHKIKK